MDKILRLINGGKNLNLICTGTESGGILLSRADLTSIAGLFYNTTIHIHKIEGMPSTTNTRVLRICLNGQPSHLSFVTENASGNIHIGKDDIGRIIAHLSKQSGVKAGVVEMPRLAA